MYTVPHGSVHYTNCALYLKVLITIQTVHCNTQQGSLQYGTINTHCMLYLSVWYTKQTVYNSTVTVLHSTVHYTHTA